MFVSPLYSADPAARCEEIYAQACALIEGEPHLLANLANLAALLYESLGDVNWTGFYLLDGGELVLGPFCGKPACIRIKPGRGVCGTALSQEKTQLVPDVHAFPGHIACDGASRSELVVPLRMGGRVVGVIDLDSPTPARFTKTEQELIEKIAHLLDQSCEAKAAYALI